MDGTPGTPGPEPLSVSGVLAAAFDLYRSQATTLWTIVAIIVVPVQAVVVIVERIVLSSGTTFAVGGTIYTTDSTGLLTVIVVVGEFLATVVCIGALLKSLLDAYTSHPSGGWRHSLEFAWRRFGALVWLAILSGVLIAIGYILIVIPGIFLTVAWIAAVPVLMFEGTGGWPALRRSWELVKGRWWATFGALVGGIVCVVVLTLLVGLILDGIANSGHVSVILVIAGVGRIISAIITYPIVAALSAVIYIDLRGRKEHISAHDLIGAGEAPASPSGVSWPESTGLS
jgi:hypothetical protein